MKLLAYFLATLCFFANSTHVSAAYSTVLRIPGNQLSTSDWTPPHTSVYRMSGGDRLPVIETIVNGQFDNGLSGWFSSGRVEVLPDNVVQLGNPTDDSSEQHAISQQIQNLASHLSFDYRVFTTETLPGFDDPSFSVLVNDALVLIIRSEDILGQNEIRETGWKRFSVDLSRFNDEILRITFSAGNTGDNLSPSWSEVRNVTTAQVVADTESLFKLETEDVGTKTYLIDSSGAPTQVTELFRFDDALPTSMFSFWSEDGYDNVEVRHELPFIYDDEPPILYSHIELTPEPFGELVLRFSTPADNTNELSHYELRYSNEPILTTTLHSSLTPLPDLPVVPSSKPAESDEWIVFKKPEGVAEQIYVGVFAVDIFGNSTLIWTEPL